MVSIQSRAPFFSATPTPHDIAWIEFAEGRLTITPAHLSIETSEDLVFINGQELHRPIELWPGSRIALLYAKAIVFVEPDVGMQAKLSVRYFFVLFDFLLFCSSR